MRGVSTAPDEKRAARPDGSRLTSLEEETRLADERLQRLEVASAQMRDEVELLAEATGGMRQQSAKMREAALRVAEVVKVAARKRRELESKGKGKRKGPGRQGAVRPPRT